MCNYIEGQLVDIHEREIYPARVSWNENGIIVSIQKTAQAPASYIMPGFVDAHIHIESTMMHPQHFAKAVRRHGTIATVSDPHEIGNVLGVEGVEYMINASKDLPISINYGVPSCVPAAPGLERSGAIIDSEKVQYLFDTYDLKYLAEMMNFPGVVNDDSEVLQKLKIAKASKKVIDGHAPMLSGEGLQKYIQEGISTDHECTTLEEALEKIEAGMKIMIREGSAAKNYEALKELIRLHPGQIMLCSDDAHPDQLIDGHINRYVARILNDGFEFWDVLNIACKHPVEHFSLDIGTLKIGDPADFIIVENLESFPVQGFYRKGKSIEEKDIENLELSTEDVPNHFHLNDISMDEFEQLMPDWKIKRSGEWNIIQVIDQQLLTHKKVITFEGSIEELLQKHPEYSVLLVINRYQKEVEIQACIVENFGDIQGVLGSSVMHDCHNLILVGRDPVLIHKALSTLIENKGGLVAVKNDGTVHDLPLAIAGLMSIEPIETLAEKFIALEKVVSEMKSSLTAPFMTLSFLALPVIPSLKLTDLGLFDSDLFEFVVGIPE